ncbi:MAG: MerR family DNA-binding transcriptional regulator [Acidobacteriota bacterium]
MKQVLSPKELATAIGVSQSSIKRWADEGLIRAIRTAGGHRRIPLPEAIRFVRESEVELLQPQILGMPEVKGASSRALDLTTAAEELYGYLDSGAEAEFRGLLFSLYLAGYRVAEIGDGPIREAMARVGLQWHHGDLGIFTEHRATQMCMEAIHQLRNLFPDTSDAPLALGGAPAGDPYLLPSLLVSTALLAEGYRTINLGPNTPLRILKLAAEEHRPVLVWLSVTTVRSEDVLASEVRQLVERFGEQGIAMAVGGRAMTRLGLRSHSGLCCGRSLAELTAFAQGLVLDPSPRDRD